MMFTYEEPDLDELWNGATQLEFTYPLHHKLFFGAMGIILVSLPLLSMSSRNLEEEPTSEIIAATSIALFGLVCLYYVYRIIGKVIITPTAIIFLRFGQKNKLEYSQIEHVRNRKIDRSIIIEGDGVSIKIEKQLQYYSLLYDIILHKAPHITLQENLTFPFILTSKKGHYWWLAGIFFIGLFLSFGITLNYIHLDKLPECLLCFVSPRELFTLLFLYILTIGWLCLSVIVLADSIHKIEFHPEKISISNLFVKIKLPSSIFLNATARKIFPDNDDPYYNLEISFQPEKLQQLQKTWGVIARYFWRSLSNQTRTKNKNTILISGNQFNGNSKDVCVFIEQHYFADTD